MNKKDYEIIAAAIWRSGFIEDKNRIKQNAKEEMRRLIALDIVGSFKEDKNFDEVAFLKNCGL